MPPSGSIKVTNVAERACVRCRVSTAVSLNTQSPQGTMCLACQRGGLNRTKIRANQLARLEEIEAERFRLLRELGPRGMLN